jgi:hypothetical protein
MTTQQSISDLGDDLLNFKEYIDYNASIRNISIYSFEKLFSKGSDRLKSWILLYNHSVYWHPVNNKFKIHDPMFEHMEHSKKIFCLTVAMIAFQVFGDGNHRTAYYFYEKNVGFPLSDEIKIQIGHFHSLQEFSMINLNSEFIKNVLCILK